MKSGIQRYISPAWNPLGTVRSMHLLLVTQHVPSQCLTVEVVDCPS